MDHRTNYKYLLHFEDRCDIPGGHFKLGDTTYDLYPEMFPLNGSKYEIDYTNPNWWYNIAFGLYQD